MIGHVPGEESSLSRQIKLCFPGFSLTFSCTYKALGKLELGEHCFQSMLCPLSLCGTCTRKHRNITSATKLFLDLSENIFGSCQLNFVCASMFCDVGQQGNIDMVIIM